MFVSFENITFIINILKTCIIVNNYKMITKRPIDKYY